jgi:formylmethanofuran dehydrogenase subunit E
MSGHATSGSSRKQVAQQRPVTCGRCGRRIRDGTGKRVAGRLLCPRCAGRSDSTSPGADTRPPDPAA